MGIERLWPTERTRLPELPERSRSATSSHFGSEGTVHVQAHALGPLEAPRAPARAQSGAEQVISEGRDAWGTLEQREACHRMLTGLAVQRAFALPGPAEHLEATRSPTGRFVYFLRPEPEGPGKRLARMDLRSASAALLTPPHDGTLGCAQNEPRLAFHLSDLPPYQLDDGRALPAPIELTHVSLDDATEPDAVLLGVTFQRSVGDAEHSEPWPCCLIVGRPERELVPRPVLERDPAQGQRMQVSWRCLGRYDRFARPRMLGSFLYPWVLASKSALVEQGTLPSSELFLIISSKQTPSQLHPRAGVEPLDGVYGFARSGMQLFVVEGDEARTHWDAPSSGRYLRPRLHNLLPPGVRKLWAHSLSHAGKTLALGYDDKLVVMRVAARLRPRLITLAHDSATRFFSSSRLKCRQMRVTSLHLSGDGTYLLANGTGVQYEGDEDDEESLRIVGALDHGVCLRLGHNPAALDNIRRPKIASVFEPHPAHTMRRNRQLVWSRDGAEVALFQPHQLSVLAFSRTELLHRPIPSEHAFDAPLVVRHRSSVLETPAQAHPQLVPLGWRRALCLLSYDGELLQLPVLGAPCDPARARMTEHKGADIWLGDHRRTVQYPVSPAHLRAVAHLGPIEPAFRRIAIERLWGDCDATRLYAQVHLDTKGESAPPSACLLTWDFAPQRDEAPKRGSMTSSIASLRSGDDTINDFEGYTYPISSLYAGLTWDADTQSLRPRLLSDEYPLDALGVLRLHGPEQEDPLRRAFAKPRLSGETAHEEWLEHKPFFSSDRPRTSFG